MRLVAAFAFAAMLVCLGVLSGQAEKQAAIVPPVQPDTPSPAVRSAVGVLPSDGVMPLSTDRERGLKPKEIFKECETCPEMVVVPVGRFTMGSPPGEAKLPDTEGPRHSVKIAKPFAVGRFHVTVDQFAAFATETGYDAGSKCWTVEDGEVAQEREGRSWRNLGFTQTGSDPAVCLNWNDAKAYVGWLARKTGKDYRLLAEAEWEYAARAGTATPFWWGASISTNQANYDGNFRYEDGSKGEYRQKTVPVDMFQPNGFDLYQVHGNAWQWVEDCWHENYRGAPSDGSAWISGDCSRRVFRGGSWFNLPRDLRAASRFGDATDFRCIIVGFRLARGLATSAAGGEMRSR